MGKTARDRRRYERAEASGWAKMSKSSARYWKWAKSFENVRVYDEHGFSYFAHSRPMLIKNGGKP